jgi:hypothetical protein
MAIYRLLQETAFDADTAEAMGHAYEVLLLDLRLADRNDPFTDIVAKEIIQVVSLGAHDAATIRARVSGVLGQPNPTDDA